MKFSLFKEIGIIGGYLSFLFGVIYFEWEAFGVFVSFVVEYFIVLIIYAFLRLHPKVSKRSDEPPLVAVMTAGFFVGALNIGFGQLLIFDMMPYVARLSQLNNLAWTVCFISLPMLAIHALSILFKWPSLHLIDDQRTQIFTGVVALSAMNVAGALTWSLNDYKDSQIVLITMVTIRIIFEVWMNHFQKSN